jgi:hypothetical protein
MSRWNVGDFNVKDKGATSFNGRKIAFLKPYIKPSGSLPANPPWSAFILYFRGFVVVGAQGLEPWTR